MPYARIAILAIAALGLAAAGCGTGGDHPPRSASAGNAVSFLKRGNDVLCEERHALAGDVFGQILSGDPSPVEARDKFLPAYRAIRNGLAPLHPPSGDAPAFAAIIHDLDAAIDRADRDPSLLLGDDDPFAQVESRMAAIGLDKCA